MYPTFREFMRKDSHSIEEEVLIQALAVITTTPPYTSWTPEEVWDKLVSQCKVVKGEVRG